MSSKCPFIHRRMVIVKIVYLLYGALLGSHLPFLNIFFRSVGLTTFQAGTVTGARLAAASLAGPLWNISADYTGHRRIILVVLCLGSAFPMFMMPWIATAIYHGSINGTCSPVNSHNHSHIATECNEEVHHAINNIYYTLMAITSFGSMFLVSLPSYIDGIALDVIQTDKDEPNYGTQRSFGSIGFSLGSLGAAIASDHFREPNMSHYTPVFFIYLICIVLLIPGGNSLITQLHSNKKIVGRATFEYAKLNSHGTDSISRQISCTLWKADVVFFLVTVLTSGFAHHIFLNFVLLLLHDEKVVKSKTEMTLVVITAHISEIFIFPFTTKIINLLRGHSNVFILGVFSFFIRFMIISYDVPFAVIVLSQTLHTIGFGLFWTASMEYIYKVSPEEIKLTMNGIMQAMYHGISNLLANILGARLYEIYGGRLLFRGTAILCGIWALVMLAYYGSGAITRKCNCEEHKRMKWVCCIGDDDDDDAEKNALANGLESDNIQESELDDFKEK